MSLFKLVASQARQMFSSTEKCWSGLLTLMITLIVITPFCGYIFQCGCDWPWLGLDEKCNINKHNVEHSCPWCKSILTGIISTGIAIFAGVSVSISSLKLFKNQHPAQEVISRIGLGVTLFVLVAKILAGLAALRQGYSL